MTGLKIALQSGGMKSATIQLFEDAFLKILQKNLASFDGFINVGGSSAQVRFMKSSSIPEQVVSDEFHCGITGQDVIYQAGMEEKIIEVAELNLSRRTNQSARVVLAGMPGAEFKNYSVVYADREYSRLAKEFVKPLGIKLIIQDGTSEEKVLTNNDFAIVATETGSSLSANGLVVIEVLMESSMVLFVSKKLYVLRKEEFAMVEDLGFLLKGVLTARPSILVKMNVSDVRNIEAVSLLLPSLASPTEMQLRGGGSAFEAVVSANEIAELIPELKRNGATGILLQDLRGVVL